MKRPAVFFDRDGVVNVSPGAGYVLNWAEFEFSPGIMDALRLCKQKGYATILVTSQQGVGKKLMSMTDLDDIHSRMQARLAAHEAELGAIYSCTCLAEDPSCTCRKPNAEMIFQAAAEHDLDLTQSWLVGDADRDIQMAIHAGVPHTIRIRSENPEKVLAEYSLESTAELMNLLETKLPSCRA